MNTPSSGPLAPEALARPDGPLGQPDTPAADQADGPSLDNWRGRMLQQARHHLANARQEEARATCRLILSRFPHDPETVDVLGRCRFDLASLLAGEPPPKPRTRSTPALPAARPPTQAVDPVRRFKTARTAPTVLALDPGWSPAGTAMQTPQPVSPQPAPAPVPLDLPPGLLRPCESPALLARLTAAATAIQQLDWSTARQHYTEARQQPGLDPVLVDVLDQACHRLDALLHQDETAPNEPAVEPTTSPERGYSFCLITNGQRPAKLARLIESIRKLDLRRFEILVGGEPPAHLPNDVTLVPAVDAARHGRLGEMRNRLTERARHEVLVVADDDLIFRPGFSQAVAALGDDWDVQCPRFLNPDGSRYWDWATHDGPRGHRLLAYDETDPHVYVTGGLCVMRAEVARRVRWNESLGFYRGEDVEFSARLREAGLRICANPKAVVIHDDPRYTQLGDVMARREDLLKLATDRFEAGQQEEAARMVRLAQLIDPVHTPPPAWRPRRVQSPVRWMGPVFNPSGYASEAINFLVPLGRRLQLGLYHHNNLYSEAFVDGLAPGERRALLGQRDRFANLKGGIVVSHNPANGFIRPPDAAYAIGRSMFETDRIPRNWVGKCNQMDEVWVPSEFNVETYARSGVERDKLVVIPGAVDAHEFDPARLTPLPLPNRARFNFLSIFEWSTRKAWDVLLAAYLREFSAEDDVCLYLRTYLFSKPDGDPRAVLWNLIREYAARLDLGAKPWPRIELLADQVPQAELPRLYLAADCLVGATRGEGWGRPQHEAMMLGLPVIATNWSGNTAFMNGENSYLVDYELVEAKHLEPELRQYQGHRWANPSERHLREVMRQLQQHPAEARAKGQVARRHMLERFSREPVADLVENRLAEIERRLSTPYCPAVVARPHAVPTGNAPASDVPGNAPASSAPAGASSASPSPQRCEGRPPTPTRHSNPPAHATLRVAWTGSFLDHGSLSHVNRALTRRLGEQKGIALTRVARKDAPPAAPEHQDLTSKLKSAEPADAQIVVRHGWPPDWTRPAQGAWVLIQPWEYGVLPEVWVKHLGGVREIWAYSEYVRRVYVESGIHPDSVKVVPLGIEPDHFKPEAAPMPLATRKRFKFLFVGGTIHRKGPDALLQAYVEAFTSADDVCLVIKDFGGQSVYQGQTLEAQIRAAQADPRAPEILHLTTELPAAALPGLYTACDCLVHPYRGEGFGLPVLEAMACGLPVVVTGGGATDDFATDEFARRLPALRRTLDTKVGGFTLSRPGWLLEPSLEALVKEMRRAFNDPAEARALGRRASEYVRREWTWEKAASVAASRLHDLSARLEQERAEIAARRARKPAPITLPRCARLGQLDPARDLFRKKQFAAAWTATLIALQERPFHPEAVLLLGEIAGAVGDSARPRHLSDRALRLAPRWKPAQQFSRALKPAKGPARVELPALPAFLQADATPRLTVCLITKNEEQFLDACLRSVAGLASQIVVVDTGSTDRTVEIARRHGAEVHPFAWTDDFSAARNAALEHARGDWVLMLDADEELPADQHEVLRQHLRDGSALAFRLPIQDTGHELEGCHHVPRLFRNAPGLFYVGRIHEQVFSSVEVRRREWGLENRIGQARLLHHGYEKEVVRSRQKTGRNLRLLEQAVEEIPNDPNLLMNLGLELVRSGHLDEGLSHYVEAYALLSAQPVHQVVPELRETLLTQLATHLLTARQHGEIVKILTSPLARAGGLTATHHFLLGLALLELRQFPETIAHMRECLALRDRPTLTPAHKDVRKAGPHHCLAMAAHALKQPEVAAQAFAAALQDDPHSRAARLDYARFLHGQRQSVAALQQLHEVVAAHPNDALAWDLGARIALSSPQFLEVARDWTAAACQQLGAHGTLRIARAEVLLLSGQSADALPLWREHHAPNHPTQVAALFICEASTGAHPTPPAPGMAAAVSQEFIKWCQRLAAFGAATTLQALQAHLDRWAHALPSAAHIFRQAVAEVAAHANPLTP